MPRPPSTPTDGLLRAALLTLVAWTTGGCGSVGPTAPPPTEPYLRLRWTSVDQPGDAGPLQVRFVDGGPANATEAVLLIHGFASDHTVFRAQLATWIPSGRRVLALDLPGHGASDLPAAPLDLELLLAALRATLNAAQVDRAVLVGHDLGVPLACAFAGRHPERCRGVLSLDGEIVPLLSPDQRRQLAADLAAQDATAMAEAFRASAPDDLPAALIDDLAARAAATPARSRAELLRVVAEPDCWRDGPLQVPVAALHTAAAHWRGAWRRAARRRAPELHWRTLPGRSHLLQLQAPEAVTALLDRHWPAPQPAADPALAGN